MSYRPDQAEQYKAGTRQNRTGTAFDTDLGTSALATENLS